MTNIEGRPICSPLFNLEPMGYGTSRVESMDSYTMRLASEHRVPRYFIDALVQADKNLITRPKRSMNPGRLDAHTQSEFGHRLASLTARPEVATLGFCRTQGAMNRIGLCRDNWAWCQECMGEWRASSQQTYFPHLWSIPSYKFCHVHRCPLTERCHACRTSFKHHFCWSSALDVCPKCGKALHIAPGTIPSNGGYRPMIKDTPEYDELASHVLAEFMEDLHRITKENLTISTDFQMLLEHCRKYDLAHTQAEFARVVHLSVATVHELATGKFPPGLANLVRIAVTCEIALAGLICPELWKTSASGSKIQAGKVNLPAGPKRKFYDWDSIEASVISAIDSGQAKPPHQMAREMGLCEKQFCLKLGKTVFRLRVAAASKKMVEQEGKYEEIKKRLVELGTLGTSDRKMTSRKLLSRKLGIGSNNELFRKAYNDVIIVLRKKQIL